MFIHSCKNGEKVSIIATCLKKNQGATTVGVPYLILTLKDRTGTIEARLWNASSQDIETWKQGQVYEVEAMVNEYKQVLQLKIISYKVLQKNDFNPRDLVGKAPINEDAIYQEIETLIHNFKNRHYRVIMAKVLEVYGAKFKIWPAAIKVHHALTSGLIWHTYTMLQTAQAIVKIYHDRLIDPELLYAGIILHDMGKIVEIKSFLVSEITLPGKIMGHISLMSSMLGRLCEQLDVNNVNVTLLQHCILASHGKLEYGSPVVPGIIEAEIIAILDNLDARLYQVDVNLKNIPLWSATPRIGTCEGRSYVKHFEKPDGAQFLKKKILDDLNRSQNQILVHEALKKDDQS